MSIEKVFEAMDTEAILLLERTHRPDLDRDGDMTDKVSVADHTRAFSAVVDYAILRAKIDPIEKKDLKESRFARAFDQFHGRDGADGGAPGRRGRKPKASPEG